MLFVGGEAMFYLKEGEYNLYKCMYKYLYCNNNNMEEHEMLCVINI